LSIGAGLYEELVFRLILMGGMFWAGVRGLNWPGWLSAIAALLISSLAFSAVHHVGSLGEPFVLGVFMFRFFAGIVLAVIFYARGFAVAVYTHAIYDVIVLVLTP
jgi:membrane protease YdiL (CAAX protease family)